VKIGITYNLKKSSPSRNIPDAFEEFDSPATIRAVANALESGGHRVIRLGWGTEAIRKIKNTRPDFIFNLAEGFEGRNRESIMPAICELFGIPHTGSDAFTLALTLDKMQATTIVSCAGVKVPASVLIRPRENPVKLPPFPLFIKPALEGSSIGIRLSSRVEDRKALAKQLRRLWRTYGEKPVLAEHFIDGREFTVGVLGNEIPYLIGIMEIRFRKEITPPSRHFIYSMEIKRDWEKLCEYIAPPDIPASLVKKISQSALAAYRALGCRDVTRIDFRVNPAGEVFFLEANPLPGLNPISGDIVILAKKMGWTHEKLILTILAHAMERCGLSR